MTTRDQQKSGTQTLTEWTGIFVQSTDKLNDTEKRVFEEVQEILPQTEKDIDELIFHVGLMFSVRIAYRNRQMKLRLMELSAFTEEHLENIIYRLPSLKYPEVAFVTDFKQEIYLNIGTKSSF